MCIHHTLALYDIHIDKTNPGTLYFIDKVMRKLIIYVHHYYKSPNGHIIKYVFFVRPKLTYLNSYGSGHLIFYGGWAWECTFTFTFSSAFEYVCILRCYRSVVSKTIFDHTLIHVAWFMNQKYFERVNISRMLPRVFAPFLNSLMSLIFYRLVIK